MPAGREPNALELSCPHRVRVGFLEGLKLLRFYAEFPAAPKLLHFYAFSPCFAPARAARASLSCYWQILPPCITHRAAPRPDRYSFTCVAHHTQGAAWRWCLLPLVEARPWAMGVRSDLLCSHFCVIAHRLSAGGNHNLSVFSLCLSHCLQCMVYTVSVGLLWCTCCATVA